MLLVFSLLNYFWALKIAQLVHVTHGGHPGGATRGDSGDDGRNDRSSRTGGHDSRVVAVEKVVMSRSRRRRRRGDATRSRIR